MSSVNEVMRGLEIEINAEFERLDRETRSLAFRGVRQMLYSAKEVLRHERGSGRRYKRGKAGEHPASAPGEVPSKDTGNLSRNWRGYSFAHPTGKGSCIICRIKSDMPYASILENGTARMKARPFRQRIIDQAKPEIVRIFEEVR